MANYTCMMDRYYGQQKRDPETRHKYAFQIVNALNQGQKYYSFIILSDKQYNITVKQFIYYCLTACTF